MFLKDSLQGCENTSDWLSEPEQIVKYKSPWMPCNQLLSYCKKLKKTENYNWSTYFKKTLFSLILGEQVTIVHQYFPTKMKNDCSSNTKPLISKSKQTYSLYLTYLFHWHLSNIQTTVKTTTLKNTWYWSNIRQHWLKLK